MKILVTVVAVLLIQVIVALVIAYSGIPDISAANQDTGIVKWYLNETREHSIEARANKITAPSLADSSLLATGFYHYDRMCRTCHGAPGRDSDDLAKGLNPHAPRLAKWRQMPSPAELFQVTKYGIKMTGMPAWGPTHPDSLIWAMTAFLEQMPKMTAESYGAYEKSQGLTKRGS